MRAEPRRSVAALLLAAGIALTGCSATADPAESSADLPDAGAADELPEGLSYVALGDSFTAAPFVPTTDAAGGCFRSSSNYPSLVAAQLRATLVDVSCSGADTTDIVGRQTFSYSDEVAPPQIEAVSPRADLVTIGIGGNDGQLFRTLVHECTWLTQEGSGETPCLDRLEERFGDPGTALEEVGRHVEETLRKLRRAAPEATLALVGYPRLVDPQQGCRLIPLTPADRRTVARLERTLNDVLARAAADAGAEYVDMHPVSRGHEICSDDPWVNGIDTDEDRALAFHPYAAGQRAVAEQIVGLLA